MTLRNSIWILILAGLGLAAALLFSLGLVKVLDDAGVEAPRTNLDVLGLFQSRLEKIEAVHGIAYLGDSTGMSGKGQKYSIPGRVDALLQEKGGMPPVISLAEAGLGPMDFYLLAAEVSDAQPAAVIVSVNAAALSHVWAQRLSHPEFASVIGGSRWLEAFGLPMVVNGVKADRLVLYPGLDALGVTGAWRALNHYQARVFKGWKELGSLVDAPKPPLTNFPGLDLQSGQGTEAQDNEALFTQALREYHRQRYGKAIGGVTFDDPALQILAAALQHWDRLNVPTLVVAIPINIELIGSLGLDDEAGRMRTLTALAEITRNTGAHFLDLHDLLPTESFADWQGHYSLTDRPDAPSLIAERIEPVLVSMIERDQ